MMKRKREKSEWMTNTQMDDVGAWWQDYTTDRLVIIHKRPIEEQRLTAANGTTNRRGQLMSNINQVEVANPGDTSSQRQAERDGLMFGA